MAQNFELNTAAIDRLLRQSPEAAAKGAKRGMQDALRDWKLQATNIAPLDKGTLRRGIKNERVTGQGLDLQGEISSTAKERNFNYAYYIHEMDAGGKELKTPGTVKKYLDVSGEQNQDKWMRWVEEEIRHELQRAGW